MLKFTVGLTLAIMAYAGYVYIGRFCKPMIRKDHGALGGRRVGSEYPVRNAVACLIVRSMSSTIPRYLLHLVCHDALDLRGGE